MAYSVNSYPIEGLYRIRPSADSELCYGVVGQSSAEGERIALVAVSDTDLSQFWFVRRATAPGDYFYQIGNAATRKGFFDASRHGTEATDAIIQSYIDWSPTSGASPTSLITSGISTLVHFASGDGDFPGTQVQASTQLPALVIDTMGDDVDLADALVVRDLVASLDQTHLAQQLFFTPCDFFASDMEAVEPFDVHIDFTSDAEFDWVYDAPIAAYAACSSSGLATIKLDVENCRCRARARFRSSTTGAVSDWIKFFGDSTPSDPAYADPDWGAAWPAYADISPALWPAGTMWSDYAIKWSEAPGSGYDVIELQVSAREYVPANSGGNTDPWSVAGPITTQTYLIGCETTCSLSTDFIPSATGVLVGLTTTNSPNSSHLYPGSYAKLWIYDDQGHEVLDGFTIDLEDSISFIGEQHVIIPWEAFSDLSASWMDTGSWAQMHARLEWTTSFFHGMRESNLVMHPGLIGEMSIPAAFASAITTSPASVDATVTDDERPLHDLVTLAVDADTSTEAYAPSSILRMNVYSVLADESGRTRVVRCHPLNGGDLHSGSMSDRDPLLYNFGWSDATEWAVPLTPEDLSGISADAHKIVAIWTYQAQPPLSSPDPRDEIFPWLYESSGAEEIDASQAARLMTLSYRDDEGDLRIIPFEGDISTTRTIAKDVSTAHRLGARHMEAGIMAGELPEIGFSGRLYARQMSLLGSSVDSGVIYETNLPAVMRAAEGQTLLMRTAHGTSTWVKITSVDLPRSAARYGDVTLSLVEVAPDEI